MSRVAANSLLRSATVARNTVTCRTALRVALPISSPTIALAKRCQSTTTQKPIKEGTEGQDQPLKEVSEKVGKKSTRGFKLSWIFSGLTAFGALITIYGFLEFYTTLTTWPKEIRKPLRIALKSKLNGDLAKAETSFREAIQLALEMGPAALEPDPLLKITGIYVELASVLEQRRQRLSAFIELRTALEMLGPNPLRRSKTTETPVIDATASGTAALGDGPASQWAVEGNKLSDKDHIRAIGLHQKLGQLALEVATSPSKPTYASTIGEDKNLQKFTDWDDAAEYYCSNALTSILKLGLPSSAPTSSNGPVVVGRDIALPDAPAMADPEDPEQGGLVDKRGLGMTMESLSEVYARKGQYDHAGQLLLQAISLLMPPQSEETPPMRDRCQAAMLMTTISSHALHPPTAKALKVSKSWSLRSLQVSQQALAESKGEIFGNAPIEAAEAICQRARAVALHNLGMLAEMQKDYTSAHSLFTKALSAARETKFAEGKREALLALRRVQTALDDGATEK